LPTRLDDLVDDEIALRSLRRPDRHRIVGHFDVQGVAIRFRIDSDRRDSHPPRSFDDPAGDLAAIGNQDALEHEATTFRRDDDWLCVDAKQMSTVCPNIAFTMRLDPDKCARRLNAISAI